VSPADPTLLQAEIFHQGLVQACNQEGLVARYEGALAHPGVPGASPIYDTGVWSIEQEQPASVSPRGPKAPVVARLGLGPVSGGPEDDTFLVHIRGEALQVRAFDCAGGAGLRAALQGVGADGERLMAVLRDVCWALRS
jgi:hypothetical protein